jgi:group I intron endonuclease
MWIYCVTCKTTGKKYVGKTKRLVSTRWTAHCYDAFKRNLDTYFARAIRKHGKEDFVLETLEECETIDLLSQREIYWIGILDTYNNGYNSTKGGDGGIGVKWSEEARKRQSVARTGMKFSDTHKINLSKTHRGKSTWNKGLHDYILYTRFAKAQCSHSLPLAPYDLKLQGRLIHSPDSILFL